MLRRAGRAPCVQVQWACCPGLPSVFVPCRRRCISERAKLPRRRATFTSNPSTSQARLAQGWARVGWPPGQQVVAWVIHEQGAEGGPLIARAAASSCWLSGAFRLCPPAPGLRLSDPRPCHRVCRPGRRRRCGAAQRDDVVGGLAGGPRPHAGAPAVLLTALGSAAAAENCCRACT